MTRIPRSNSPVEIRQGFQRLVAQSDVLTDGALGQILVGAGVGVTPVWTTELTALTKLTVDNITIDAATIVSDTGAISLGDDNLSTTGSGTFNFVDLPEITPPSSPAATHLRLYVEDFKGFSVYSFIDDTGMVRKIVRDSVFVARNMSGLTIPANRAVYASGHSEGVPTIDKARANSVNTMPAIGVTLESIAHEAYGRVMQVGLVENVDTSSFSSGDILYVSSTAAGILVATPPLYPNVRQEIGTILVDDATVGTVQVVARSMFNDGILDHGGLLGLADDDHTVYSLADGTRDFSGVVAGVTPTDASHLATKGYVDDAVHFLVDYYFNDTASDIGGIYYQMTTNPTGEAESSFPTGPLGSGNGQALVNFATNAGEPGVLLLEQGVYSAHIHAEVTAGTKPVQIYFEIYRREADTTETLLATSETSEYITSKAGVDLHAIVADDIDILAADRVVIKWLANVGATGSNATVVLYAEGVNVARVSLPTGGAALSVVFLRADGGTDLTGNLTVDAAVTVDGRDISVDGTKLDTLSQTVQATNNNAGTIYKCYAVYADDNDDVDLTDASDEDKSRAIGLVADTSIASAASGTIRTSGILSATTGQWDTCGAGSGSGLVAGTKYYLGTVAGTLSSTRPTQPSQYTVSVGVALSTTDMLIRPQKVNDVVEQITEDLTIYVSTTGNDATGIGDASSPLATLAGALSFLGPKLIASTATVTIEIADGTYTETDPTEITHPNGNRISIVGENTYDISMTSVQGAPGGSAGAWSVVINVSDVSNAAVNDYLLVPKGIAGGTRPVAFLGAWKITNVDAVNTRLTVTCTSQSAVAPSGAIAGTVTIVKTVLQYNGCHGLRFAAGSHLGLIDKLVISGNDTASMYGIYLQAMSSCTANSGNIAVVEWARGVEIDFMSALKGTQFIAAGCGQGIVTVAGTAEITNGIVAGGTTEGVRIVQGSVSASGAVVQGCVEGVDCQIQSSYTSYGGHVYYCTNIGLKASYNSYIYALTLTFGGNGTDASPVVNTLGNTESYISWS